MVEDVKIVWLTGRAGDGQPIANEGMAWDGKVPVGKVRQASGDPENRGSWRWSMFAYGRNCRGDRAFL